jgi:hypothetical protein
MTRKIGFLMFPDFQTLDLTGPLAAFEMSARTVFPLHNPRLWFQEPNSQSVARREARPTDHGVELMPTVGRSSC